MPPGGVILTEIGDYVVELTTSVTHRRTAQVTTHPIEGRREAADHIRVNPAEVSVQGVVSNDPLSVDSDPLRMQTAYDSLMALMGQRVALVTELESYSDMGVTSLTVPQDAETGAALRFEATLQALTVRTAQSVAIPPDAPPAAAAPTTSSEVDRGTQTGTDSTDADSDQASSILAQLFG